MLLTLRLWVDRIHKDKLSSSFWIRVFNPKCSIIMNYEVNCARIYVLIKVSHICHGSDGG